MSSSPLYFRQLLAGQDIARTDPVAAQMVNFVYLIGDREAGKCVVVDPAWNVDDVLRRYRHVLVPELNPGQLRMLLRARTLLDLKGLNKVDGTPFMVREVIEAARQLIGPAAAKELRA